MNAPLVIDSLLIALMAANFVSTGGQNAYVDLASSKIHVDGNTYVLLSSINSTKRYLAETSFNFSSQGFKAQKYQEYTE